MDFVYVLILLSILGVIALIYSIVDKPEKEIHHH